jgi:imidazolonepropionase-like amidohydrolase
MPAYHLRATVLPDGDRSADLWVVDGKVTFVPQDNAEELAPTGGYVLPGLVDCHYHLTLDLGGIGLPVGSAELAREGLERHLASGTLLVRDMGVVSDAVHRVVTDALPRVQSAGTLLAPPERYFGIQEDTTTDELVGRARAQAEAGHPWVKIIADFPKDNPGHLKDGEPNYPQEVFNAAVEAAHVAGARVASHAVSRAGTAAAIDARVDSLEHGCMIDESLLKLMVERGIAWSPTSIIAPYAAEMAEEMGGPEAARGAHEAFENQRSMLARANKLGITLLAGTDMFPPGSVWREVAALQQAGIEPRDALAAASTVARAFLREPALDEGAPADLVWYEHDPRNEPELLARPGLVMLGGARIH